MMTAPVSQGLRRVLLATAHVLVTSAARTVKIRALLDQGSTRSFVSEAVVRALKGRTFKATNSLVGVGGVSAGTSLSVAPLSIGPKHGHGPVFRIDALILQTLTTYCPQLPSREVAWPHLQGLELADDHPTDSEPVQLLIGADLYGSLLLDGVVRGPPSEPVAQNTVLGWVLSGPTSTVNPSVDMAETVLHCVDNDTLHASLTKFWEIESIPTAVNHTVEEVQCEEHFAFTHTRTPTGQYVVRLPFKTEPPIPIGASRVTASRSLTSLDRRLSRDSSIHKRYSEFMAEYEALGHMERVPPPSSETNQVVYLTHHPVVKPDSTTTQLRVVFNASALTTNFTSLNSHLMIGPKLQSDLFIILSQWRAYQFVYTADIAKMYRQIQIHPDDRDYQRILWKATPGDPVQEFRLTTVTYGTACAPYLALKVLQQLTLDEGHAFPLGAQILKRFVYVDDCLFGANDLHTLSRMKNELCDLLSRGHFVPRKWGSNVDSLLAGVDPDNHGLAWSPSDADRATVKVLGLVWAPSLDSFNYNVAIRSPPATTKRQVLALIASLFDPLGWVSPVIVRSKMFMQSLWRQQITWDDPLSLHLASQWAKIHDDFGNLSNIVIPR